MDIFWYLLGAAGGMMFILFLSAVLMSEWNDAFEQPNNKRNKKRRRR